MLLGKLELGHFFQHLGYFLPTFYYMYLPNYMFNISWADVTGQTLVGQHYYSTIGLYSYIRGVVVEWMCHTTVEHKVHASSPAAALMSSCI